ncbi:hypothetical protein [Bacteroides sp.]|nr:hypothetical protein [Bacteroides sp.]
MNKFLEGREIPFGWSGWQGYALWFIPIVHFVDIGKDCKFHTKAMD